MSPSKRFKIVFVCTGNICRSPMAEGILRKRLSSKVGSQAEVVSAGVAAAAGFPASENSVIACADEGVDISLHRSQPVSRLLLEESDLILAMEDHHADTIKNFAPDLVQNVELLARYGTEDNPAGGIPDPIGGSLDEYRAARDQIRNEIITALPRIEREILAGVPS